MNGPEVRSRAGVHGEGGWVALWMLGLALLVLALGGLSLDLWRAISERRELAAAADAGVIAGSSAVDEAVWRSLREVRLERDEAISRALRAIALQPAAEELIAPPQVEVAEDGSALTVKLVSEVDFTLLRLLAFGAPPFRVEVEATAAAALVP
ncbi:MAG TPA: pilus assembly protein TadG-related protein [Acidimicrobiia bacterium]|nr:pilus assembly protein TadG-related protein [Acidimicrobiia bacterium]